MKLKLTFLALLLCPFFLFAQKSDSKTVAFRLAKSKKYGVSKGVKIERMGDKTVYTFTQLTIPFKNPEPFTAFSFRLEGLKLSEATIKATYCVDTKNWQNVGHNHEMEEEIATKWVSELLYLDKNVKKLALKIEVTGPSQVRMAYLRYFNPNDVSNTSTGMTPESVLNDCTMPPSVSRATWGASQGLNETIFKGSPSYSPVTHLIVHHSAGPNTSTNWNATVASIFDYHVNSNGWSDVGYNWLIAPNGTLYVGRGGGNNVVGAHYCGKNTNTMGVCMMGTYMTVAPTDTALKTLERILAWKSVESNIDPLAVRTHSAGNINTINGHRSGCSTECPGDMTWSLLPQIRQNVATRVNACRAVATVDLADEAAWRVFPNPTSGDFYFQIPELSGETPLSITLFDVAGKPVFAARTTYTASENAHIHFPQPVASGFYLLHARTETRLYRKKIQIAR